MSPAAHFFRLLCCCHHAPCDTHCPHHRGSNRAYEQARYIISRRRYTSCSRQGCVIADKLHHKQPSTALAAILFLPFNRRGINRVIPGRDVPSTGDGLAPDAPRTRPDKTVLFRRANSIAMSNPCRSDGKSKRGSLTLVDSLP